MATRLSDRERKRVIADRVSGMSLRQLARKYNTSCTTIQRIVSKDPKTEQLMAQKKDENTADILRYMDGKREDVCNIISLYLEYLQDPDKVAKAGVQALATSLGIVIDKFTGTAAELDKLRAEIAKLRGEQQQTGVHHLVSDLMTAAKKRWEKDAE